ncbi:hypothetical protein [Nakamurella endophytica]|uniref:Pilus assembly protein n=1 Tax=Nakamurella endophytica TaxID=1748367 RepID=A0A917T263_9ACTN|nr:hypothetical protein [Nakamurella endophytica]GGM07742.1 hypothetical protein GCM10011594_29610 [Nakamurella endophytica]
MLAVLVLIPAVYILVALLRIQAVTLAVDQAARDAGRAMDSAASVADGAARARAVAEIDLADQRLGGSALTVRFVAAGSACTAEHEIAPSLAAGSVYDVCVTAVLTLPGVPSVISGRTNTVTGVYTVHVGELREGA